MGSDQQDEWWRPGVAFAGHICTATFLLLFVGWLLFLLTEGDHWFENFGNPFSHMVGRWLTHFVLVIFALIFVVYVLKEAWRVSFGPAWKLLRILWQSARRWWAERRDTNSAPAREGRTPGDEDGTWKSGLRIAGLASSVCFTLVTLGGAAVVLSIATTALEHRGADALLVFLGQALEDFVLAIDATIFVVFVLSGGWHVIARRHSNRSAAASLAATPETPGDGNG